jgi:hypothetical protein
MDWKALLKKFPRRHYLRPEPPSRREKRIGYAILFIVASIGIAVFISSRYYDQNLFRLDPKLLNKEERAEGVKVEGGERRDSRGLDGPAGDPYKEGQPAEKPGENTGEKTEPAVAESAPAGSGFFPGEVGTDWKRSGAIQRFTSENLYDKIDGRENLYKSFEFRELQAADYAASGQQNRFIQVELFDMTTTRSALGVFAAERPQHPTPAKIGREAYIETNGAFFWKGKFYVRVIGSDAEKSTQQAAITLARSIAERLPDMKDETASADPLPSSGRVANSTAYIRESAFGQSFFTNVSSARYKIGNQELTGFVMAAQSPAGAAAIVEEFGKAMSAKLNPIGSGDNTVYHVEVFGSHYVIFSRGRMVGGVMEAEEKDPAIKLAQQIAEHASKQK